MQNDNVTMKKVNSLTEIPHEILEEAMKAGIDKEEGRAGSFFHIDHSTVMSKVNEKFEGKIEVMDIKDALGKYGWLEDYRWHLVDKNKDEYTRAADREFSGGYFLRILKGAKVELPLQSCLFISEKGLKQRVHNIVIAEEGSEASIITGCALHKESSGEHVGISEFFVKKGAKLNFTMIHNWSEETVVRPRSAALVDDGATFVSNYICMNPVKDLQMYPKAFCKGVGSTASFNSIIYAKDGSKIDVGSAVELSGKNSRAEIVSRTMVSGDSQIIARGMLEGIESPAKGHLECRGLILDDNSRIHAIPEIIGSKKDIELSHEAAVGKIAEKEITYLMSRGLSHDEAMSTIVRGFMDVGIMGLSKRVTV
ncbi:MAG: hypothetical protein MSIBF_02690 [Candidatus Altiarchaeales archaeon IMC4]|nr:MAG: hypothetical protein MSIBF_02690 [Candidatus Altiarchaeales archaeon IMC4]